MTDYDEPLHDDSDSGLSAFDIYTDMLHSEEATGLSAFDHADSDSGAEESEVVFFATNASGTVTVSAKIDGCVHSVSLSAQSMTMTEAELAREILAVADVAAAKGRAGQYELISGMLRVQGQDEPSARELLVHGLGLPTPEEAIAAEAELVSRHMGP
ncbi:DUF2694 family protein [Mycobacterium sp. NPDC003323]